MSTTNKKQVTAHSLREHIRCDIKPGVAIGLGMTGACALGAGLLIHVANQSPDLSINYHQILQSTGHVINYVGGMFTNRSTPDPTKQDSFTALFDAFVMPAAFFATWTAQNLRELVTANKNLKELRRTGE